MSAVTIMDDDEDAPRPKRRRAPPRDSRGRSTASRKGGKLVRRRARDAGIDENRGSHFSGWIEDLRARMKRSAAFTSAVGVFFLVTALAGIIAGGHVPKAIGDARTALYGFLGEGGLTVTRIKPVGQSLMPPEELYAAIGLEEGKSSIFEADPHDIRMRLEALPWVARADVRRVWPNRVEILIVERRPVALWQSDGKIQVVDRDGAPITAHDPQRFANLLLVVGAGAAQHASALIDMLGTQPTLTIRVKAAVFVGQRRWNLRLDNGVEVRLPEEGAEGALLELVQLDKEQQILAREIDAIDLRFPDRLIVKLPANSPLNPQRPAVEGRDT